jgi:hypothetical protein
MAGLNNTDAETARQILSDIDNRQFKHALAKVDKKLKKTDSEYFKVWLCELDSRFSVDLVKIRGIQND